MISQEDIYQVIQNFDFEKAKKIYDFFGENIFFKKEFEKNTSFSANLLKKELIKIWEKAKVEEKASRGEAKEQTQDIFFFAPEPIKALEREWRTLFKDASARQQRLAYNQSPDEYEDSVVIINNFERIREIWAALDYWKANNVLPAKGEKTVPSDLPTLMVRQRTVERYIRLYKDKPSQKAKYEAELKEIKKNIDAFRS